MIKIKLGDHPAKEIQSEEIELFKNELDIVNIGHGIYNVIYQNRSLEIIIHKVEKDTKTIQLSIDGKMTQAKISDKMDILLEKMGIDTSKTQKLTVLKAPMPGLIVDWLIKEGDHVVAGDKLLILEAMKMENVIKASGEGIIKKINVLKGLAVEKNQVLVEFE